MNGDFRIGDLMVYQYIDKDNTKVVFRCLILDTDEESERCQVLLFEFGVPGNGEKHWWNMNGWTLLCRPDND